MDEVRILILVIKPIVDRHDGRWRVTAWHLDSGSLDAHWEYWQTHLSAMNCALAIARTSRCATEEEPWSKP